MSAPPTDRPTRALCILWPAFLMAGVLEMLVFAVVDPGGLQWFGSAPIDWQPTTVYSVTFLMFWLVISLASSITQFLTHPEAL
jgi:hypothetical protein